MIIKKGSGGGEQDGRRVGRCGVHLSPQIHQEYTFRHRSACRTPAERGQEYLTSGKEYRETCKTRVGWGTRGKTRNISRTGPALSGWGNWSRGPIPTAGQLSESEEKHLKLSETPDLWQPKWNENQTVFATAIHSPERYAGHLEGAAAGTWNLGIVEQCRGEGCCWWQRDGLRGCEGGDHGGRCQWRKARQPWKQGNTAESHVRCGVITIASLSP